MIDDNNENKIRKETNKMNVKGITDIIKDTNKQDYVTNHNRPDNKTDCINGQHHFIAIGDPITKQDIIQCSECDTKLEEHLETMRQRRDLRRAEKEANRLIKDKNIPEPEGKRDE